MTCPAISSAHPPRPVHAQSGRGDWDGRPIMGPGVYTMCVAPDPSSVAAWRAIQTEMPMLKALRMDEPPNEFSVAELPSRWRAGTITWPATSGTRYRNGRGQWPGLGHGRELR